MRLPRILDEAGVALPMALMALALLTALMLALAAVSQTEPSIAANHLRGSQARALAESGLAYALWSLARGLPAPLPGASASAPLDGATLVALGPGGFTVRVASHADGDPDRRTITAVGWVPTNSLTDVRPKARRQITADAAAVRRLGARAPCALCVRGALDVVGNVSIGARNADPACGDDTRYATFTRDATTLAGAVALTGGAGGSAQNQPAADFDAVTLSPGALDALRTVAWRNGTYYGPGFPRGGAVSDGSATWTGRITFDASHPLREGVVFVDTTDGRNAEGDPTTITTLAEVRLDAGAVAASDGVFRGWIVVNGSLEIAAGLSLRGLLYAVDGFAYRAAETGRLEGLAVSLNLRNAAPARLETSGAATITLAFDCAHADAAGVVPLGFVLLPGTYRED
jgi:Tfp pilus assembly protein PilX